MTDEAHIPGPNEVAALEAVAAADMGGTTHGTLVISLARAVDADLGNAGLVREYRIAEASFRAAVGGAQGDSFTEMMTALAAND